MPQSSKPKKKYRPKPVAKALNARDAWAIEGDVHAVLLAMEFDSVQEEHLAMLAAHGDMVRRLYKPGTPERRQADTIIRVISEIKGRKDSRVLSGEEAAIRAAAQVTLPAIRRASNMDIYRAASSSLRDLNRQGGAMRVTLP